MTDPFDGIPARRPRKKFTWYTKYRPTPPESKPSHIRDVLPSEAVPNVLIFLLMFLRYADRAEKCKRTINAGVFMHEYRKNLLLVEEEMVFHD